MPLLEPGDAVPSFTCAALDGRSDFIFDSAAGRPMVLLVLGSGRWGPAANALALLRRHADLFDDRRAVFFGITVDPGDVAEGRVRRRIPGIRWFLDYDARVSRLLGAVGEAEGASRYTPHWLLLDSNLRVVRRAALSEGEALFDELKALLAVPPEDLTAPVMATPRVFEPALCRRLIALYEQHGGGESGVMREENGMTVGRLDHSFKRRKDYHIEDMELRGLLRERIRQRLVPQIRKSFNFNPTRIERWIVACYDGESGGFFRPHRDNTTAGTAHRRFACSINLNAEEFEGGDLRFPEYGQRTYRPSTGGAVVFSCALLHEATPVTRGRRYAFLPFFYDEAAAAIRERNQVLLAQGNEAYQPPQPAVAG